MGCVASKLDINDVHPNMFAVNNIDDMGTKLSSGQLEITDSDLILYQKGKQPVKWPLKYLKRYGFEAGLFSFEVGRKTPTGPGVYAFKCRRAEKLFNLLQVRVREQGPDRTSMSMAGTPGQFPSESPPGPITDVTSPSPDSDSPVQDGSPSMVDSNDASPAYINCNINTSSGQFQAQPSSPGYLNIIQELPNTSNLDLRHEYENIGPDTVNIHSPNYVPPRNLFLPPKPQHLNSQFQQQQQQNVTLNNAGAVDDIESVAENSGDNNFLNDNKTVINSINYIVLDLDSAPSTDNNSSPKVSDTSLVNGASTGRRGYVTIDFDKTDALIKSANHRYFDDDPPGIRKTRHNSSLSELGPSKLT